MASLRTLGAAEARVDVATARISLALWDPPARITDAARAAFGLEEGVGQHAAAAAMWRAVRCGKLSGAQRGAIGGWGGADTVKLAGAIAAAVGASAETSVPKVDGMQQSAADARLAQIQGQQRAREARRAVFERVAGGDTEGAVREVERKRRLLAETPTVAAATAMMLSKRRRQEAANPL